MVSTRTRIGLVAAIALTCLCVTAVRGAHAALTVDIIEPASDPFQIDVGDPCDFEAIAYIDGEELPYGEVTWDWDFGDLTDHSSDNPTVHTYTQVVTYTVTVTATYSGQQAQDTATAQAQQAAP